jgi:hypothetical protein
MTYYQAGAFIFPVDGSYEEIKATRTSWGTQKDMGLRLNPVQLREERSQRHIKKGVRLINRYANMELHFAMQ